MVHQLDFDGLRIFSKDDNPLDIRSISAVELISTTALSDLQVDQRYAFHSRWAHECVDGSPDLRYNDNREIVSACRATYQFNGVERRVGNVQVFNDSAADLLLRQIRYVVTLVSHDLFPQVWAELSSDLLRLRALEVEIKDTNDNHARIRKETVARIAKEQGFAAVPTLMSEFPADIRQQLMSLERDYAKQRVEREELQERQLPRLQKIYALLGVGV